MDDKYVQYLIITWIIALHLESFYRNNELSATDEVDELHGNLTILVIQSECKTELSYHVIVCIFGRQQETANREYLQLNN